MTRTDDLLLGTVTVTKTLTADDVIVDVTCETPDGEELPLIDSLGMLELAKDSLLHGGSDDDED